MGRVVCFRDFRVMRAKVRKADSFLRESMGRMNESRNVRPFVPSLIWLHVWRKSPAIGGVYASCCALVDSACEWKLGCWLVAENFELVQDSIA